METSAHSDTTLFTSSSVPHSSSSQSSSTVGMSRLLRAKRSGIDHTLNKAHHRLSLGSSTASAYAGHLSSMVYGKIKSLWTAQTSTANSGLNQLAGTLCFNSVFDFARGVHCVCFNCYFSFVQFNRFTFSASICFKE